MSILFFNDMINIKNIYSDLLNIQKKSYKSIDIYYIGHITVKGIRDFHSIRSINPLYLKKTEIST